MTGECFCHAGVQDDGWRQALWTRIFGKPEAPITQPFPLTRAGFPDGDGLVVFLDKSRVSSEQLQLLAQGVAKHFGLDPVELLDEMRAGPVPIKCGPDVSTVGCSRHVLGAIL